MSWKNKYPATIRYGALPSIGPFKIMDEPENLGKGKFRAVLVTPNDSKFMLTTWESTIGDILYASKDGYCEGSLDGEYVRFNLADVS